MLVSRALASDLGAASGGTVLVRLERPSAIPIESLQGRKDDRGRTLRLTVRAVLGAEDGGEFSLRPQQGPVRAVFVSLKRLQQELDLDGRVNTLVVADRPGSVEASAGPALREIVRRRAALEDVGLTVRALDSPGVLALESPSGVLDSEQAAAADRAAAKSGLQSRAVFTYLASALRSGNREVPYSLVTAIDLASIAPSAPPARSSTAGPPPIVLNDWTARDLGVKPGDPLTLEYPVWQEPGQLVIRTADFTVAAVVPIAGLGRRSRPRAPVPWNF